ncbi:unnamed protein product [Cuscuta europaea]|uniref:Uncharacterized protein n=1 Tax=Cuscuta europaea TaxID=41803 RepID=A0A9P0YQI6_CUSEU|nr:unnamed protein product [Cuscuta europaea]
MLFEIISHLFRLEAIEMLDGTLNGLHVAKVDGNHISLSLRTCIPNNDGSLCQEKVDSSSGLFDQYHKLEIELVEGTMELKHAEAALFSNARP